MSEELHFDASDYYYRTGKILPEEIMTQEDIFINDIFDEIENGKYKKEGFKKFPRFDTWLKSKGWDISWSYHHQSKLVTEIDVSQSYIGVNDCYRFYDMTFRSTDLDYLELKLTKLLKSYNNKFVIEKFALWNKINVWIYWDTFV